MNLKLKILSIVSFSCLLCAIVAVSVAHYFNNEALNNGLIEKARTIHSRLDVATDFVAKQGGLALVINKIIQQRENVELLTQEDKIDIMKQVPIVAAMKIGAQNADKELYTFRIFSNEPRREEYRATPEEMKVFNKFLKNPNLREWITNDGTNVTVYRPVYIKNELGCLTCHGDPATSPWKNGKDILGYKMENWSDGKLHGVFAIISNRNEVKNYLSQKMIFSPAIQIGIYVAIGSIIAIIIAAFLLKLPLIRLQNATDEVSAAVHKIEDEISSLTKLANQLNATSNEQASAVQETAASMEEISSMGRKNTDNAKDSQHASNQSKNEAQTGQQVVSKMVTSMQDINESNDLVMREIIDSNNKISEIVRVINEIDIKTKVINDIVFQTKLLSFNASVEAQRAGEHGKGFAVVAEEVGNLAQMSGKASKEISTLLEISIKKVEQIVQDSKSKISNLMNISKKTVDKGSSVANECGVILSSIVESSEHVLSMVESIVNASEEQSKGIVDINTAIHQIDRTTQKTVQSADGCAKTASTLNEQIQHLKFAYNELNRIIEGTNKKK